MIIMALNCGSSSVKYQLFDWDKKEVIAKGMVERVIIGDSFIMHEVPGREVYHLKQDCPNHQAAIDLLIRIVTDPDHGVLDNVSEISAVGHRVVHGGEKFTCSVLIDEHVLDAVKEVQHLAPLHNPPNIEGIEAARTLHAGYTACRHIRHSLPPDNARAGIYLLRLPYEWYEKYQVRRYGFHGTSHLYVSKTCRSSSRQKTCRMQHNYHAYRKWSVPLRHKERDFNRHDNGAYTA